MRKKKRNKVSDLGKIIDYPLDKFKEEVVSQGVPIGVINNYILVLEGVYADLVNRKAKIIQLVYSGEKTKEEVASVLNGIYAEMTKLELKIVFLKSRVKTLLNLGD